MQQHLVEATQFHHGAVVALHELFHGKRVACVFIAKQSSKIGLVIEQQPILPTPGQQVESVAHTPEEILAARQFAELSRGQKTMSDEFVQGPAAEMPLGDPADYLDVPQTARTAFYVGFKLVGRVIVTVMTQLLLFLFCRKKAVRRPDLIRGDG